MLEAILDLWLLLAFVPGQLQVGHGLARSKEPKQVLLDVEGLEVGKLNHE